jgi:ferredoxin
VIIVFKDVRGVSNPDMDCGIAGQNMVLAAHSMGLGTCWVSFITLAFDYIPNWYKRLGISYPYKIATSLAIGWPQGEPDGMVARQIHAVDWYESGMKRSLYASTQEFSAWEKFRIPTYNDPEQIQFGRMEFDYEKCISCSICARACPASSIVMENKKPTMKDECMFCGDCVAICPVSAIRMKTPYRYTKYFKNIDHGPVSPPQL